jgi:hypothetical protein
MIVAFASRHIFVDMHRLVRTSVAHVWFGLWCLLGDLRIFLQVLCVISAFGCEPRRMLSIDRRFGKHCSCHFQGECVVGRVLEALCGAGRRWRVRFDGADWWSSTNQH